MMFKTYSSGVRKLDIKPPTKTNGRKPLSLKKSLPESFKNQVKEMAKRDAENGVYMSKDFIAFEKNYLKENISPDREAVKSQVFRILARCRYTDGSDRFFKLPNSCRAKISVSANGQRLASVCNEFGEEIVAYNSFGYGGGWTTGPTREETRFWNELTPLYSEAWDEAWAEIKKPQTETLQAVAGGAFHVTA